MIDLDDFTQLRQFDRNHLLLRAAQIDQRWPAVQATLAILNETVALPKFTELGESINIWLALPPELLGIGQALCALFARSPSSPLWLWAQNQRLPDSNVPVIILSARQPAPWLDLPTIHGPSLLVDLSRHISADQHPAQVFLLLYTLCAQLTPKPAVLLDVQSGSPPRLAAQLAACLPDLPFAQNPAKRLAMRLYERMPFFWGDGVLAGVATDWQLRMLWYAETVAWAASLPELARIQVMARLPRYWFNVVTFVHLTIALADQPLTALETKLDRLFTMRRLSNLQIAAPDNVTPVEAIWYLLEMGEWLALYTAALYNVDPADRVPLQFLE